VAHCFVDIVLVQSVMHHFCCLLHSKWYVLGQILSRDEESASLQGFNYITKLTRWFRQESPILGKCISNQGINGKADGIPNLLPL
jgi:hypothetical protein